VLKRWNNHWAFVRAAFDRAVTQTNLMLSVVAGSGAIVVAALGSESPIVTEGAWRVPVLVGLCFAVSVGILGGLLRARGQVLTLQTFPDVGMGFIQHERNPEHYVAMNFNVGIKWVNRSSEHATLEFSLAVPSGDCLLIMGQESPAELMKQRRLMRGQTTAPLLLNADVNFSGRLDIEPKKSGEALLQFVWTDMEGVRAGPDTRQAVLLVENLQANSHARLLMDRTEVVRC